MHICKCTASNGNVLKANFNTDVGMNLMSLTYGKVEAIDQNTKPLFEERMAGLGALIGPHFHHRKDSEIPLIKDESLFPFIANLKENGQKEFLSHGIARYVPWKYGADESSISAILTGDDEYKGIRLKEIEGQDFELRFKARLNDNVLYIHYLMEAEKPSVIGLHYYYALDDKTARIKSYVQNQFHHPEGWKDIPREWLSEDKELQLKIDPEFEADFGFRPAGNAFEGQIELFTSQYRLEIDYQSAGEEHAWQVYHPKDATFVCIEPVSAKNPREAKSKSASLQIQIKVFD